MFDTMHVPCIPCRIDERFLPAESRRSSTVSEHTAEAATSVTMFDMIVRTISAIVPIAVSIV
ncbi:MAG: hypothetical protein AABZ39_17025 [Spirochaetota bacterium]